MTTARTRGARWAVAIVLTALTAIPAAASATAAEADGGLKIVGPAGADRACWPYVCADSPGEGDRPYFSPDRNIPESAT